MLSTKAMNFWNKQQQVAAIKGALEDKENRGRHQQAHLEMAELLLLTPGY
jgi:hypothetical protein